MAYRQLANPGANANNLVEVHTTETGCCSGLDIESCTYTATVTTASLPGTLLTYKDPADRTTTKTYVIATGSTPATIVAELKRVLPLIGFKSDGLNLPDVTATVVSANTVIVVKGEPLLVSITATTVFAFAQTACSNL